MTKPIQVLLIEDNPADADLMHEAITSGKLLLDLATVRDGVAAIQYLRGEGPYSDTPRPDLILLDLNLPKMDGRQVLAAIKADADLRGIPVVVLTSSTAERDIVQSYNLGANCYVIKPVDLKAFQCIVKDVENFWFTVVRLPANAAQRKTKLQLTA
jgi:two-component system, chemotaxis family, response regulator Rcp1